MSMFFISLCIGFAKRVKGMDGVNAKTIYFLSAKAMGWMTLQCAVTFLVEAFDAAKLFNIDGDGPYDTFESSIGMLDMMVTPVFGVLLLSLAKAKPVKSIVLYAFQLPIFIALIAEIVTKEEWIFYTLYIYIFLCTLLVIVLTHIYVHKYQHLLMETYSNTARRGNSWVLVFEYFLIAQFSLWLVLDMLIKSDVSSICYYAFSLVLWTMYVRRIRMQNFDVKVLDEAEQYDVAELPQSDTAEDILPADMPKADEQTAVVSDVPDEQRPASHKDLTYARLGEQIHKYCVEERNFANPDLTVLDLVRAIGSNRTYTAKWFSDRGENFNVYINNLRLEYAENLLRNTDESIVNIYTKSGFSTPHNFRRVFKLKYGCSPTEYRANMGK